MGNINFINILKTISESMKCPSCGNDYELEGVHFISKMDGYTMAHLSCNHCLTPVWVNFFTVQQKTAFEFQRNDSFLDFGEISSNEIINFHQEIKKFDGDFKRVFGYKN